jgi:DNA-binding NarL/FixJ family response regulator
MKAHPRLRRIPVVIFTSSNSPRDIIRSYDLQASSFLRKPVDFDEYNDLIHLLESYWLDRSCPPPQSGITLEE